MLSFGKKDLIPPILPANNKQQFLKEVLERHIYWFNAGENDYAEAYQTLIHAFTTTDNEQSAASSTK